MRNSRTVSKPYLFVILPAALMLFGLTTSAPVSTAKVPVRTLSTTDRRLRTDSFYERRLLLRERKSTSFPWSR